MNATVPTRSASGPNRLYDVTPAMSASPPVSRCCSCRSCCSIASRCRATVAQAAASAIAPITLGEPPSCRAGPSAHTTVLSLTAALAPPPARYGSAAASQSARPTSAPQPNGAYSLWPEIATQSTPSAVMSTARCGASWAASRQTRAPCAFATAAISATGKSSPVTFDAPVTQTSRGPSGAARSASATAVTAAAGDAGGASRTVRSSGHGSRAAWCSVSNTTTVVACGKHRASRLSASVVCRVNTTWSSGRAPTKECTSARACSYHWVVIRDAYPLPRCTDAYDGSAASTARRTASRQGALAPWSRFA